MRCAVCGKRHTTRWPLVFALIAFAVFVTLLISCSSAEASSDGGEESRRVGLSGLASHTSPLSPVAEDHCPADVDADHEIDTADIAAFTNAFGQGGPLDIFPELAPNGSVDTGDIALVTAHFGEKCYGFQGSEPISVNPFGQVTSCAFKAEGWWRSTLGSMAIVQPMAGLTGCYVGFDAAYSAVCSMQIEAWNGAWYVVDGTAGSGTSWMVNGALRCSAENNAGVGVPMYTAMREKACHQIWRDGVSVHGYHCHQSPTSFFLPCDPSRPETC